MFKNLILALIVVFLFNFQIVFAYHEEVAHFSGVDLLLVNYDYNGEWKSRAYSHHMNNGRRCLIVCTHGCIDYNGFRLCIGSDEGYNYVFSLENELIYWHNIGKIDIRKYDHIHLNACYSGYMQQEFVLPRLQKTVYVVSNYTGITYYSEWIHCDRCGRVTEVAFGNVY